jgi:hypothetical protein
MASPRLLPVATTRFDRSARAGVADKVGGVASLGDNLIPKLGCNFVAPKVPSSDLPQRGLERRGERNVPSLSSYLRRGLSEP